jgi:Raf kinase inhibitor-like YbhB/YbcL family protein
MAGPSLGRVLRMAPILFALQALPLADAGVAMALKLTSSAFQPGGTIPSKYTCEGDDISPPLAIDGVPAGAKSLALIIDDPDAPDPKAPKRVWVHWVIHNLPFAAGHQEPARECGQRRLAEGGCHRDERLEAEFLSRPVSAHRAASLFPQALRPRHHASSRRSDQVRARGGHNGSYPGPGRAHGHVSEGRSVGAGSLQPPHLTVALRLA